MGTFVNRLGTFVWPFMTLYLTRRGYSAPQAGLALAMYGLGGIGSQIFGGLLTDRIGRRNAIAFSMLTAAALTLVLWQATSLAVIYPVMALLATAAEMHRPAASALIADLVPSDKRVTAYAVFRLAINVGWACGLAFGGFLADRSFDYLFIGDAVTSATFGIISLIALPHGVRTSSRQECQLTDHHVDAAILTPCHDGARGTAHRTRVRLPTRGPIGSGSRRDGVRLDTGTAIYAANPDALWFGCGVAGLASAWLALGARRHPTTPTSVVVDGTGT